jgi:hypothetical protein
MERCSVCFLEPALPAGQSIEVEIQPRDMCARCASTLARSLVGGGRLAFIALARHALGDAIMQGRIWEWMVMEAISREGEVTAAGLAWGLLGVDYRGAAYYALWRALRRLEERGVLVSEKKGKERVFRLREAPGGGRGRAASREASYRAGRAGARLSRQRGDASSRGRGWREGAVPQPPARPSPSGGQ